MKFPWQAAAKSSADGESAGATVYQEVRPHDVEATLQVLGREAAAGLIHFTRARGLDGYDKARIVRDLMAGLGLTADSFQTPDGHTTKESFVFAAAARAGRTLEGWELDEHMYRLRRSDPRKYGDHTGTLQDHLDEAHQEHRHWFGRDLKVKAPQAFLESRLGAYARVLAAHRIAGTSRLTVHPDAAAQWAEQVGQVERRMGEALDARRAQHDRLLRSKATEALPASTTLTALLSALTGFAAAKGSLPGVGVVGLVTGIAGSYVATVLGRRGDIAAKAGSARREARTQNADLHRLLGPPAASRGR